MEEKQRMQLPRVKLGSRGLEVSRLGFGCAGLSGALNAPVSREAGCLLMKRAFDLVRQGPQFGLPAYSHGFNLKIIA